MRTRTFSVEQANQAIPLVRRVAEDVVRHYRELDSLADEYRALRDKDDRSEEGQAKLNDLKRRMATHSDEIDGFVAELKEVGCEMKDLSSGVIDFPSELDERPIYLCWQLGEKSVDFWHEVTEGFQGRTPLPVTVSEE